MPHRPKKLDFWTDTGLKRFLSTKRLEKINTMDELDSCNLASPSVAAIVPGTVSSLRHILEIQASSCLTATANPHMEVRRTPIDAEGGSSAEAMASSRSRSDLDTRPTVQQVNIPKAAVYHNDRYGHMTLSVQLSDSSKNSDQSGSQYMSVLSDGQTSVATPTPVAATTPLSRRRLQQETR